MISVVAFSLGFLGSLHCIGMCGPLLMLVHSKQNKSALIKTIVYHLARITVYIALGLILFSIGESFRLFGFQQYMSLGLGVLLLLLVLVVSNPEQAFFKWTGLSSFSSTVKKNFGKTIQKNQVWSRALLGGLNGLLPCGLVYSACMLTLNAQTPQESIVMMASFGVGTLPALLMMNFISQHIKISSAKLFKYSMIFAAVLLILRGANLNIPYLSPGFEDDKVKCCHK